MTTILIDADTLAYKAALAAEKVVEDFDGGVVQRYANLEEASENADAEIAWVKEQVGPKAKVMLALTGPTNFRKAIMPTYKSKRGAKPTALNGVRLHLVNNRGAVMKPQLEADDIIGIWATHPHLVKGPKIVASIDKDLRSVPCTLWAMKQDEKPVEVTKDEADYWHLRQTLTGDAVDGYPGCPTVGPVKADAILMAGRPTWETVVAAYAKRGLDADAALLQARVARICRFTDFNFKTKEPILWTPAK